MNIAIPSYNRASYMALRSTFSFLRAAGVPYTVWVRPEEAQAYTSAAKYNGHHNAVIRELPPTCTNLYATRDFIVADAVQRGDTFLLMLDDDLEFSKRGPDWTSRISALRPTEWPAVVDLMQLHCSENTPLVSLQRYLYAYRECLPVAYSGRPVWTFMLHVYTMKDFSWEWSPKHIDLSEFAMPCALLRAGLNNVVLNTYIADDRRVNLHAMGPASDPSLVDMFLLIEKHAAHSKACAALAEKYPEYLTLRKARDADVHFLVLRRK